MFHVVSVVGNHQGNVQLLTQGDQPPVDFRKLLHVFVTLQLKEVPVAEHVLVPLGDPSGFIEVAFYDETGHFRRSASRQYDEALAVLLQQLAVDPGTVVEPVDVSAGDQLHKITVTLVVAGQQDEVIRAALVGVLVEPAALCDVDLATYDRLDARLFAGHVEVHHAVHGPMVGDGQGVHAHLLGLGHQLRDTADAVQHAVFGVDVKVRESVVAGWSRHTYLWWEVLNLTQLVACQGKTIEGKTTICSNWLKFITQHKETIKKTPTGPRAPPNQALQTVSYP